MITWPITITRQASLWVHTTGECAREATEEDLAAAGYVPIHTFEEVQMARRDLAGTCPHCHNDPCTCTDFQRAYKPPSNDTPERIAYAAKNDLTEWVIVRRIQALIDASKSPAHRQAIDYLCIALFEAEQERDAVVDRICEAVTFDSGHYPLDVLMVGKLPVAVIVDGPGFVHRIRAEIRKAAGGSDGE